MTVINKINPIAFKSISFQSTNDKAQNNLPKNNVDDKTTSKYLDNLKSFMYNDIARSIANNPQTSLGIARQMYQQLEKTVN